MLDVFLIDGLCFCKGRCGWSQRPIKIMIGFMYYLHLLARCLLFLTCCMIITLQLSGTQYQVRRHNVDLLFVWPCRDLVHRQTASAVVQHMSLGVYGFGCEDSLNHLLNYVWPNVFETSPHVIQAVMGALEGLRVAIGPCRMLQYCLQVRTFSQCLTYSSGILVSYFHSDLFLSSKMKLKQQLLCQCPILNYALLFCTTFLF